MPHTLQEFLISATRKAADDLVAALMRLPQEKWNESPMGEARSPLDVIAECAILNGSTAELIQTRHFPPFDPEEYGRARAALIQDWDAMQALLKENTEKVIAVIRTVPNEDLDIEVAMPWGPMTLAQIVAYPYWNMSYHEGQINYVASMLGLLK